MRSRPLSRRRFAQQLGAASAIAALTPLRTFAQQTTSQPQPIAARVYSPLAFGAQGDGTTKDTAAIQRCLDACAAAGGGTVALDENHTFLSGSLTLRPHVTLWLSAGSTLKTSPDREDFHATGALLFAESAEDLHIAGTGVIDGNFAVYFPPKGPDGYPVPQPFLGPFDPLYPPSNRNPPDGRPRMILLVGCRRILLQDFTIRNAPTWTIHPVGCDDLHINGISILNDLDVPNCDGIDIDHCRGVRIEGCHIVAGDDCLVLKASRNFGQYGPCEGVTIANCTLESSSAGIKIEAEGPYPVRSAAITNCTILRSNRGISFLNRDGATVEDLLFSNLVIETRMRPMMWWGSGEPIALSSVPRQKGGSAGLVRGISFTDLLCRSESGIYMRGSVGAPLSQISLRNIELSIAKTTSIEGGFYDMRPTDSFGTSGLDRRRTAGVFAADVAGLSLSGIDVHWPGPTPAYFGSALDLQRCTEVSISEVTGDAAHPGEPSSHFDQVSFAKQITRPVRKPASR